jgi:hypothetical protein
MAIEALTTQQLQEKYLSGAQAVPLAQPIEEVDNTGFFEDFSNSIGAAFELDNTAGSYFADETRNTTNDIEENYDVFQDIQGYEDYASSFIGVRNSARSQAIKNKIDRENAAREVIASAGAGGVAASMVASIFDPVDWAVAGLTGGIGIVGKAGKLARIGIEATTATIATEAALQATQETRTINESMINIASAPAMIGLVKSAQVAVKMAGRAGVPKHINIDDAGDDIVDSMTNGVDPRSVPDTSSLRNVGAAQTRLNGFGSEQATKLAKEYMGRSQEFEFTVGAGKQLTRGATSWQMNLTPIGRMVGSISNVARKYVHAFLENGFVTKGNIQGVAKDVAVETSINRIQGQLISAVESISDKMYKAAKDNGWQGDLGSFQQEVGKAMSNGDIHANQYVQDTAKEYRKVLDRIKQEAVDSKLLPEDLDSVTGADSYFTRVYNRETIRANADEFRDLLQRHFIQAAEEALQTAATKEPSLGKLGVGITDEEMTGEALKNVTRDQVNREIDSRVEAKMLDEDFDGLSEVNKRTLKNQLRLETLDEYYNELVEEFSDVDDYLAIIEASEKSFMRSKQVDTKLKMLEDIVFDIKSTINRDLTIDTSDIAPYRAAAIDVEQNILGDGMYKPTKTSTDGFSNPNLSSKFKKRVLTLTDNELEQYLVKDASAVIRRNIMSVVPQIQVMKKQKLLGVERPDLEMTEMKNAIKSEYREKLNYVDKEHLVEHIMSGKWFRPDDDMAALLGFKVWTDLKVSVMNNLVDEGLVNIGKFNVNGRMVEGMKSLKKGVTEDQVRAAIEKNTDRLNEVTSKWTKLYTKHMNSDLNDLEVTRQLLLGELRYKSDPNTFWNKNLRNLRTINYMSMLGGVAISSVTDIARHGMVNGIRGMKGLFSKNSFSSYMKSASKQEMQRLGVVSELLLNKRAAELADIQEGIYETGPVEKMLGKMSNGFSKYTGMMHWNDFNKQVAAGMTGDIILEAAENVSKGIKLDKALVTRLAENGLDEYSLRAIGEQFSKHGERVDGLRLSNAESWDDVELRDLYSDVLRKQADMAVITPSVGDKPLWATSSEFGKSVFQFQSFTFAANNRQALVGANYNTKNLMAWSGVQLSLAYMVISLKDAIKGKEPRDWDNDFSSNALELVDRSGIIPMTSYFSKAGQGFGITSRNRYEESTAIGSLLGPSLGSVDRARQVITDAFDGKGYEAWSNASKLMPYQNHPFVQILEQLSESQNVDLRN